jgi:Restriction endonuclease
MATEPDWRKYEKQIYERLVSMAEGDENAEIVFDKRMPGRRSGTDRQVDVYVEGSFAGGVGRGTMAVDCKCLERNVDVKAVETFISLVEDVGTDFGLMVTNQDYSEAARIRAGSAHGVRVEIVPYGELADWTPEVLFCPICTGLTSDRAPGPLYIDPIDSDVPGAELVLGVGRCWTCNAISMRCSCGTLNTLLESDEGDWLECEGGCRVEWKVQVEIDRKGLPEGEGLEFRKAA